jgi:hypothetical protein
VQQDDLDVFGGDRFLGEFSLFERSMGLVSRARRIVGAGRDPEEPAFVVYRLGRGLVIRVGTPQWSAGLADRQELQDATERIWSLLRRGRAT